jgi:glucose-1-phosphate thymidylyltransferase
VTKGIIIAGGLGTRLWPSTIISSKQLLPIYDKPLIYYPLTTLILAGISEIEIIVSPSHIDDFKTLLGDGSKWGLRISFCIQPEPKGIPEALTHLSPHFQNCKLVVILGDNLLFGMGLGTSLQNIRIEKGALAFAYQVSNPSDFGVVIFDATGKPIEISEKPHLPKSNFAIPGLYFLDDSVFSRISKLMPSVRGEFEIVDLLESYLEDGLLEFKILERGTAWLDTGTQENMLEASEFVRIIEKRQGQKIGCPEEAAFRMGLINRDELKAAAQQMPIGNYRSYIESIISD